MTILLVDDHPADLDVLVEALSPLGERLLCATSGQEALSLAKAEELALVLLDLHMPELDGLETAALFKASESTRKVPILLMSSATPTSEELARGYRTGAIDVVEKPVEPEVLRSKVSALVEQWRSGGREVDSSGRDRLSERLLRAAPCAHTAETIDALLRISAALSEDLDRDRLMQRLAAEMMALTSAVGAAFVRTRDDSSVHIAHVGDLRDELSQLGTQLLVAREMLRPDRPTVDRRLMPEAPGSLLAACVVGRTNATQGVILVGHPQPDAFDERDEQLIVVAATYAASALEHARLLEQAETARQRAEIAELALLASEARLRIALEAAGLGTWDYNPLSKLLRWDARCKSLSGLSADADVSYDTFLGAIHPEDRLRVDAAVQRALDPVSDGSFDVEYRTIGIEDGMERWISARGLGITEHGRTVRFLGAMLDITQKKRVEGERAELLASERRARAAAESASREKDEFLATVSHELRNPLNAILGWARVLVEDTESAREVFFDRAKKGLLVILRNAKAQSQLVEDILEVSRIVTGKLRLSTRSVDVASVIESGVETIRAAAQAKRVHIAWDGTSRLGTMVADADRVQQIVWNLLSNAVKFTPAGGSVEVCAGCTQDRIVLTVKDSGEGIDPDFLPYVFDRFRQFDGSTTRRHGGLGLGLAIVRHLTELHGGTVGAHSDGRGKGATFTVEFPRAPLSDGSVEPTRSLIPLTASRSVSDAGVLCGKTVLVLDDDGDMRDLVAMILQDAGARVAVASSVAIAIGELESHVPDVIVSDLAMPGEDGFTLANRVRTSEKKELRSVPLVAMTAYARAEDRRRVLSAGFDRHVAKPIEPDELVGALAAVILNKSR